MVENTNNIVETKEKVFCLKRVTGVDDSKITAVGIDMHENISLGSSDGLV